MRSLDWADFKNTCIVKKNLNLQYEDLGGQVRVVGPDANSLNWEIVLEKNLPDGSANPDYVDFDANVKVACNFPIGTRPYSFATSDFTFDGDSVMGTCLAGQTKELDYEISPADHPLGQNINGAIAMFEGSVIFDWVEFQVVDKSNRLPAPFTGAVIDRWVHKWGVPACPVGSQTIPIILQTPYAGRVPGGLWLRAIYHSTGATDVKIVINHFLHTPS